MAVIIIYPGNGKNGRCSNCGCDPAFHLVLARFCFVVLKSIHTCDLLGVKCRGAQLGDRQIAVLIF